MYSDVSQLIVSGPHSVGWASFLLERLEPSPHPSYAFASVRA